MNNIDIFKTILGNLDSLESKINFITTIINTIPDPVFVKDHQHRWLVLNDALCEFIGMPREELIGKTDYDFFPKEEADVFWKKDDEVFKSGLENINEEKITNPYGVEHIFSTRKAVFVEKTRVNFFWWVVFAISLSCEKQKKNCKLRLKNLKAYRIQTH